ncbi:MAG: glycosyl hydrolase 115 family protein [Gemmatimonadaceae bacterium]
MRIDNYSALGLLVGTLAMYSVGSPLHAQEWNEPVRGSWVETAQPSKGGVVLAAAGLGCEIVISPNENSAVQRAGMFLVGDIERISGYRPPLVERPTPGRISVRLVTLGVSEMPQTISEASLRGKWESYEIATTDSSVWLVGSSFRGTAFAAYTLSERLGIDPLYLWTGYTPARHDPLVLKPTRFSAGPPSFRYRGFFHDDEDILPRPFENSGYPLRVGDVPLEWYQRFFETALRLRMNMVAPYTRAHRRFEVQKMASDWGLFYTSHHYDVLLSNPFGITRFNLAAERGVDPTWDWFGNRAGMVEYWRAGAAENRDLSVVWPVGMRGIDDHSYAFPPGTSDSAQTEVFRDVIRTQVGIVKSLLPPDSSPPFHFTMYTEMLGRYQRDPSAFNLPRDVIIVWPDNNDGRMRALPSATGNWKHGIYYHLAYFGGDRTMQSAHVVSPAVVVSEFRRAASAGATEFVLVNVSELREFVMEARMIAEIAWDAPAAFVGPDAARRYVDWWSREYFGAPAAYDVAAFYERYHSIFDNPTRLWFASNAFHAVLERAYAKVGRAPVAPPAADTLALIRARETELRSALAIAERATARMSRPERRYFFEHAELPLLMQLRHVEATLRLDSAVAAHDAATFWTRAEAAVVPLEQLETEIRRAERPPFESWYRKTWIRREMRPFNVHRPFEQLRVFLASEGRERLAEPAEARLTEAELRRYFPTHPVQ